MRIARLEIFGFKSFLERFVLNFDQPIVGIVGPNGCGKSNIVDSLRWALGETHAKQLRGSTLEDVIFNGSDTRRPLGMAEVSITIRPEPEWKPATLLPSETVTEEGTPAPELSLIEQQAGISRLSEAVPGLFEAAEIQITRRLYRSGESEYFINRVPCRLRDTVDLYRAIGLGSRGLSIVAQGQIGDLISKKPVDRRELLEDAAGISGFRVRLEASQRKLEQTATNMARLGDIITEVEKQVVFLRRQAKRARSRNELKERERELAKLLFESRAAMILAKRENQAEQLAALREQLEHAERSLSAHGAEEERFRSDIEQLDVRLNDERRVRDDINRVLNDRAQAAHELHLGIAEKEGKLAAIDGQLRLIDERKEAIGIELERRKQAVISARSSLEVVEAKEREAEALQPDDATNAELQSVSEQLSRARGELSQKLASVTKHQMELASKEGELKTLERQALLASGQNDSAALSHETIASSLRVPESLEHAVSAVLGPKARCSIVDSLDAIAADRFETLRRSKNFWGAVERSTDAGGDYGAQAHGRRRLIDSLEVADSARAAVEAVLGNVLLVDSLEEGRAALRELGHQDVISQHFFAVTLAGELVFPWGVISPNTHEALFALQRQIEERRIECSELESRLAALREEANRGELAVADLESKRNSLISHKEEQVRSEVNKLIAEAASLRGLISFESERMNELRSELTKLAARGETLLQEQRGLHVILEQLRHDEGALLADPELNEADLLARRAATESEIVRLEGQKGELRVAFAELLQQLDTARRASHELNSKVSELTLATDRFQMELSMLHDDIRQRFGEEIEIPTLEIAQEMIAQTAGGIQERIAELHQESDRLRQRLEREGEVDPQAIELYEAEEKRLSEMQTQLQDLTSAKDTLERTIKELKEVSRVRFIETFEFVNNKFQELVPRLFGGGSGHLELINPDDPLSSGVEMSVRPPGKKLRSMELLSGGEKALVAVSLLMSMFLYRPSPICVLDEVDAPLDDANLERFLDLIKEIGGGTQFLIITHNKITMAAADKLIGITMQEKGVSTALAVSFVEAEKELERLVANQ